VDVRFVGPEGVVEADGPALEALLARDDGFVWVDVPVLDEAAETLLRDRLHCHPAVVDACRRRNHVPSVHAYPDMYFTILHAPLLGEAGHVHLLELDQLVGARFLVTVHGPINPALDADQALSETRAVLRRIREARFHPTSPGEVSYALGSAMARRQRELISEVAERLPEIEEQVMAPRFREPEELLERMFLIRHELTTARTMAAQSHDIHARLAGLEGHVPEPDRVWARDLADQFERVRSVGDGEAQFLHGVIELYQTRVNTKMTVAMERLAVIAAVTLPITAIASVLGMNIIVSDSSHVVALVVVLLVMLAISAQLLRWARRQGWW
jgi:Mg2+ and Co2+ transporter CorA